MNRNVLAIDVGGSNVKILASGEKKRRKFPSGDQLTAAVMVKEVKQLASGWNYDAVSIGYPGPVRHDKIVAEPHNLGTGWVACDFAAAFDCPVRLINDAAMQALGGYRDGRMLFLGFGTGLGSTLIVDGTVVAMELGHLPYRKKTYEDYVGVSAFTELSVATWSENVHDVIECFRAAFVPDDILIGGGKAKRLASLPAGCRLGKNADAFTGGFRLWEDRYMPSASAGQ
ncbi:MAG: ROK family protein [Woeseia sp.]